MDNSTCIVRAESVEDTDGDILRAHGIYSRWIDYFGTKVAELSGFYIAETLNGICLWNKTRVSGHEAVDIRPNLQYLCSQSGSQDRSGIVASAASEVGDLFGLAIT